MYYQEELDCFDGKRYYEVEDEEIFEACEIFLKENFTGILAIDVVRLAEFMSKMAKRYKGENSEYYYSSKSKLIKIGIEEFLYNEWKIGWYKDEKDRIVVSFIMPNSSETISLHFWDQDNDFDLSMVPEDIDLRELWIER